MHCPDSSFTSADRRPAITPISPQQQLRRDRVESVIGLAAPFLDLVLAAGERVSRIVGRDDEYIPIRPASEALELPAAGRRGDHSERAGELAE